MILNNLVEGFVYGELSPLMAGQISSKAYRQSAKTMLNMFPDVRGPAVSRPGWLHALTIEAEEVKLATFQEGPTEAYVCAFTPSSLTIVPNNVPNRGLNFLVNGSFTNEFRGWSIKEQSNTQVSFAPGGATLTPGSNAGETITFEQSFQVPDGAANYEFLVSGLFKGPAATEALVVSLGTTKGGSELSSTPLFGDLTYQNISINAPGTTTLFVTITALDWSATAETDTEALIESLRVQRAVVAISRTVIASPYTAEQLHGLRAVRVPNSNKLYVLHPDVAPYELVMSSPTSWALTAISFTSPPAEWVTGSYPATLTFHEGRSYWSAVPGAPETFWASKSAAFTDLTTGVLDDDAFSFTLDREGAIKWILSSKNLLLGSTNGEYKIGSDGGLIAPTDVQVQLQSAHGASAVPPELMGTETAFTSVDQRSIRTMAYYWQDDGWVATNISHGSEHITEAGIVELDIARNPDPVLWATLRDGSVVGCSYQFEGGGGSESGKRVSGWHRHNTHWPIVSITVIEDYGHSVPWAACKVEVDGVNQIHLGYLDFQSPAVTYLDNSVYKTYNSPTTAITGLGHLEGYEVEILADGGVHENKTVVSGAIELNYPAQQVFVGLGFTAKLETQPVALMTKEGALRAQLGRWNKAKIYLIDSMLPLVEGLRAAEHTSTGVMGYKQPLFTGYIDAMQEGWEEDTTLTIEQDLPYPLTIGHVAGEVEKVV